VGKKRGGKEIPGEESNKKSGTGDRKGKGGRTLLSAKGRCRRKKAVFLRAKREEKALPFLSGRGESRTEKTFPLWREKKREVPTGKVRARRCLH